MKIQKILIIKRLKELKQENSRLRKVTSDRSIDKAILKEGAEVNLHSDENRQSRQMKKSYGERLHMLKPRGR